MASDKYFTVHQAIHTYKDIKPVIDNIVAKLDGTPVDIAVVACLATAIAVSAPDIEEEEFLSAIWELSQYLIVLLTGEDAFDEDMTQH